MKRILLTLCVSASYIWAQQGQLVPQNSQFTGIYNAFSFAYGVTGSTVPPLKVDLGSNNPGVYSITLAFGYVTLADGSRIVPITTNTPITVGQGPSIETVTPTSVSCPTPTVLDTCMVVANFTHAHGIGESVASGTVGLQESLNAGHTLGGAIVVDGKWANAGGTQGMINTATVYANTTINDNRLGDVFQGSGGGGSTPPGGVPGSIQYNNAGAFGGISLGTDQIIDALTSSVPVAVQLPQCNAANQSLQYSPGVGFSCATIASGGGTPAGVNGDIQINNSGQFGAITLSANALLGALTAHTPGALALPSCSSTNQALQWTSGTGFSCVTISGTGGTPASPTNSIQYNSSGSFGGLALSSNTVVGSASGTAPTALALPSCNSAGNALQWASGTGYTCTTISSGTALVNTHALTDLAPPATVSGTSIAFGTAVPSLIVVNGTNYTFSNTATVALNTGTAADHIWFYVSPTGQRTLGYNSANTWTLTNFEASSAVAGITAFPNGSYPEYDCTFNGTAFTTCTDDRPTQSINSFSNVASPFYGVQIAQAASGNTLQNVYPVNSQSGTSYTVLQTDLATVLSFTNTAAKTAVLPQAGLGGNFANGTFVIFDNSAATSGTLTVNPSVSTINGVSSLSLSVGQTWIAVSDGTNWRAYPWSGATSKGMGTTFDGGGVSLGSGKTTYFTSPYSCNINSWSATVDTGTITFDIWKIASGTAIPTVTNTIVASAPPAISTGTALHSSTLTGWTTAVSINDILGFHITAVSGATVASLVLNCQ